jgi:hypothetical protein
MVAIVSLLFWLVVIPFCIGMIPVNFISPSKRNPGLVILAGYFCMWAVFEVVTIPAVLFVKYDNFQVASNCFTVASLLCAVVGVVLWQRNMRGRLFGDGRTSLPDKAVVTEPTRVSEFTQNRKAGLTSIIKRASLWEHIEWLIFFALVGFQLYKAVFYTSFDGDDAYYVVESLIAQQADVMYRILPYTGGTTSLDVRHALAVFPMWIAFIAVKSGIHATIVSHVVMPLVLIPLTYLVYYEIGKALFSTESGGWTFARRQGIGMFMVIMCMFQMFGNVSIYTNETFFLTRTWQGKAVTGSLVIPAVFWILLWIYDSAKHSDITVSSDVTDRGKSGEEFDAADGVGKTDKSDGAARKRQDAGLWFLLVCVNMTAGICSSIAVFIITILVAVTAFCLMFTERDFKVLIRIGAACLPNLIYMGIYVLAAYGNLL